MRNIHTHIRRDTPTLNMPYPPSCFTTVAKKFHDTPPQHDIPIWYMTHTRHMTHLPKYMTHDTSIWYMTNHTIRTSDPHSTKHPHDTPT